MPLTRIFLGWTSPALPAAAAYLTGRFADALQDLIVVIPTARSARRLLEHLVRRRGGALDAVPTLLTPAELAEHLYDAPPPADPWTAQMLRAEALRGMDREALSALVPTPPDPDDVPAWWELARRLTDVIEDSAAAGLSLQDLIERIERMKLDDRALDRLRLLRSIESACHAALRRAGLHDVQQARLDAIARRACRCDRPIVLLGTVDLSAQLARMLEQVAAPVTAMIHAPPDAADRFDDFGRFVPDVWRHRAPPITDAQLCIVDRPADQARQVVATLAAWSVAASEVTIGLADESLGPAVRRAVEHAGAAARDATGRAVARSRPGMLLRAAGRFAGGGRFDDFAALLRHPDVLAHVGEAEGVEDWLTFLDEYATRHLQGRLIEPWLGERRAAMKQLWDRVTALLPPDRPRPLSRWAKPIASLLQAIYPGEWSAHDPADHDPVAALQAIGRALGGMAAVPAEAQPVTFTQAVALLLQQLGGVSVPEPADPAAIEMIGFLELPLDDAGHLILTGVNEGHLPAVRVSDAWLPDSMRRALGMADGEARLARDACLLTQILHSRRVMLITARVTREGDPLAPSRLLLRGDDESLVRRAGAFFAAEVAPAASGSLLQPGPRSRFLIPRPAMDDPPLTSLPVTAFRDYLACPLRFYLKHVRGLRLVDDGAVELEAAMFGTLAHEVLERFAASELRDADRADVIAAFLSVELDAMVGRRFGDVPRMAVRLQVEMLRERLSAFARVQAEQRQQGWRIVYWEGARREGDRPKRLSAVLSVDGEPFTLTGRIDRIDHHAGENRYRILDYKTADTGPKPDKVHRDRGAWVDLQLPLYRDLACELLDSDQVELGYVNLPKKTDKTGVEIAPWDDEELTEAREVGLEVVRRLRERVFWPPKLPPGFDDGLGSICGDGAFNREELVRLSGEVGA